MIFVIFKYNRQQHRPTLLCRHLYFHPQVCINDAPHHIRLHLLKKSTQLEIEKRTGTAIVTRVRCSQACAEPVQVIQLEKTLALALLAYSGLLCT